MPSATRTSGRRLYESSTDGYASSGARQPDQNEVDPDLLAIWKTKLDANAAIPKAGHTEVQRLSRTEYIAPQ